MSVLVQVYDFVLKSAGGYKKQLLSKVAENVSFRVPEHFPFLPSLY